MQKTENDEIINKVMDFFTKCRAMYIPVTGLMLKTKANELAVRLGIEDFQASDG